MEKSLHPLFILLALTGILCWSACGNESEQLDPNMNQAADGPLAWTNDVTIYEVNIRQYTPEGTLAAFAKHLPRLKELGVEVLWFMPVYPISTTRSKGTLGSYYAISNYVEVNAEFGTMEEFKTLVKQIHDMDMKVMMDWVANHTGWDHHWIEEHPDWYTRDEAGNIMDPSNAEGESYGWTDVADLNFDHTDMRQAMIDAMLFWVKEVDVDGFRCDVAFEVPDDFWIEASEQLQAAKPLYMLAEAEHPPIRENGSFHVSYGWSFHHLMNKIAKGEETADAIQTWLEEDRKKFKKGYHMHFITNHDENSWNGTEFERMGEGVDAFAVLSFTFEGVPLIYSGQEAAFDRRLEFFEKDSIEWGSYSKTAFYQTLTSLKRNNQALWNGLAGGAVQRINTSADKQVYAYLREKNDNRVLVVLNLSSKPADVQLQGTKHFGAYTDIFANSSVSLDDKSNLELKAWDYLVLSSAR